MIRYTVLVADSFKDKFEAFLANINLLSNGKQVATIAYREEIVAVPREVKSE